MPNENVRSTRSIPQREKSKPDWIHISTMSDTHWTVIYKNGSDKNMIESSVPTTSEAEHLLRENLFSGL